MAVVTWDGSASTDFATAANWDTGSVPNGTSDVVIPDTSSINNPTLGADITINSLEIQTNATIVGNASYTITCDGEASAGDAAGHAFYANAGALGTLLNITITTQAATNIRVLPASGTLRDLTINHSSCAVTQVGGYTINNNLTITAGSYSTGSDASLTVTGQCLVNGGTLTLNGSTVDFGDVNHSSGTINGNTSTIDLNTKTGGGWIWYQSGGTWNYNTCTVNCKQNGKHINANDWYNLNIECPSSGEAIIFRDNSGNTVTVHNDLTIKEGHFKRDLSSDTLTVTGDVSVESGGTLGHVDQSAGAENFGSLTIASGGTYIATSGTTTITSENSGTGIAWNNTGGTFTHNSGKVSFTTAANTIIRENTFYDFEMTADASGRVYEIRDVSGNTITIANDLTIKEGNLKRTTVGDTFTVTRHVSVESGGTLGHADETGANNFGSLTIASGGTYIATSGTTKITSEAGSGYCIQTTGTFTHNKGLVEIDFGSGITEGQNGPYWDLLLSDPDSDFYTSEAWEIYNNFDLVGDFDVQNNAHHITVHGNMTIGDGSTTTRYMNATAYTNNLTVGGTLHITNGATADLGTHGTVNVGGIRNTGGSIS